MRRTRPNHLSDLIRPDDFDRDRVLEIRNRLGAGVAVRLDGYWRSRTPNGAKLFEFIAQCIAIRDEPRIL